jgi:hypothetical protein
VRWQLFLNSLRGKSRDSELAIGLLGFISLVLFAVGTGVAIFFGSIVATQAGQFWIVNLLLWAVFLLWQLAPILFEGYSPGLNFREIARYPISFRLYYLLNSFYGLIDPVALVGVLWLACLWMGITAARPASALLAAILCTLFALFNLFCNRIIVGVFERFQSTRKGRERLVVISLALMLAPQAFQLLSYNWARASRGLPYRSVLDWLALLNRFSPPGLVIESLSAHGRQILWAAGMLATYALLLALLLRRQIRAVYQGEIYAEGHAAHRELRAEPGWTLPGLDEALVAIAEKELRYVRQNSRLMVSLIYPIIVFALFLFTNSPARSLLSAGKDAVGGVGIIAVLLLLNVSNVAYNIFGMDQGGFSRWLLSPLPLKKIVAAKNLANASIFLGIYLVVGGIALARSSISLLSFSAITVGFTAVLVVQLSAGNLVSAHWPKKIDPTRMSSRMASHAAGFASLLVTFPAILCVSLVLVAAYSSGYPWLPAAAMLALLAAVLKLYSYVLGRTVEYIYDHLEEIESTLTT